MMILEELRNLAAELGMELFYFVGRPKIETETVTYENFSLQKHVGLLKDGEMHITPVPYQQLREKLRRAVGRKVKSRTIEKAQS